MESLTLWGSFEEKTDKVEVLHCRNDYFEVIKKFNYVTWLRFYL